MNSFIRFSRDNKKNKRFIKKNFLIICIKRRKQNKKRSLSPSNEFTESDIDYFLTTISNVKPYPKIRDLRKLLAPRLSLDKINTLLKYLQRSNNIIVDLDGNIVWIKENNMKINSSISDSAKFSKEFLEYFGDS